MKAGPAGRGACPDIPGRSADIATWHFSRDRGTDGGWKPVYDCWDFGERPGWPPVSSNEPIGPGSSVAAEPSAIRLVMAAAFAYSARLPMYVFHSRAGVMGKTRFEDTPAITQFRHLNSILPGDLPGVFAGGKPNQYWPEVPASRDGCVRNTGSRKGDRFVYVPIGIRGDGLPLQAREDLEFDAFDPLTGKVFRSAKMKIGETVTLPPGAGGLILTGRVLAPGKQ